MSDSIDPGRARYLAKKAEQAAKQAQKSRNPNEVLREKGITDAFFNAMASFGVKVEEVKVVGSTQIKVKFIGVVGNTSFSTKTLDTGVAGNLAQIRKILREAHEEIVGKNPAISRFVRNEAKPSQPGLD